MNFMQYVGATMGWLGITPSTANTLARLLDDPDVSRGYAFGSIADMDSSEAVHPTWPRAAMAIISTLESVVAQ